MGNGGQQQKLPLEIFSLLTSGLLPHRIEVVWHLLHTDRGFIPLQKSNPAYLCAFLRQCMWTQPETGLASLASYFLSCGFLYFNIWLLCQTLAWILWTCNVSKELPASGHFCWFNITVYMHLLSLLLIVGQMLLLFYSYWVVYCTEELPQKYLPNQLLRPVNEGPQIWYKTLTEWNSIQFEQRLINLLWCLSPRFLNTSSLKHNI